MGRPPKSYPAPRGLLIDEILQLERPRKLKQVKTSVEWDDGDEDKAEDQHSKDISDVLNNNNRLKKKKAAEIHIPAAKNKGVVGMKNKKRARAENEMVKSEESEEEYDAQPRGGIKKANARAIIKPRGRLTRKVPPTPTPAPESDSDSDSSALAELYTETESSEEDDEDEYSPRRSKYAKYGH